MKPLLLPLITLALLATSATYACDAHNTASHQGPKPTITTNHKAKIHTVVTKKSSSGKAQQTII